MSKALVGVGEASWIAHVEQGACWGTYIRILSLWLWSYRNFKLGRKCKNTWVLTGVVEATSRALTVSNPLVGVVEATRGLLTVSKALVDVEMLHVVHQAVFGGSNFATQQGPCSP